MRDVLIIAKCDKCHKEVEVQEGPLPKWVIAGSTYRPELCDPCQDKVLATLDFLTPVANRAPKKTGKNRTGGKFTPIDTPCPVCHKVFKSAAGKSQHFTQIVKQENRNGAHRKYLREEEKSNVE